MDLRQLRYFVAVADARNITRASERLHIAQSPLSRQIQQLEAEVGAPLLDRSSRPLGLTSAGRLLYEQAKQMLARMDDMQAMMQHAVAADRRRFAIGFVASIIYARLPPLLRAFRAAAPPLDLDLVELSSLEQVAALKEGRIDLGFGRIRFADDAVASIVLQEEPLVAAVASQGALGGTTAPVSLAALAAQPLILYPTGHRPSYADQVIEIFRSRGLACEIGHEARELQIALGLVAAEEGVCLVPEAVQRSQMDNITYRPLIERAVSPIIMSRRAGDPSREVATMMAVIARSYMTWGYAVPPQLAREAARADAARLGSII